MSADLRDKASQQVMTSLQQRVADMDRDLGSKGSGIDTEKLKEQMSVVQEELKMKADDIAFQDIHARVVQNENDVKAKFSAAAASIRGGVVVPLFEKGSDKSKKSPLKNRALVRSRG